MRILIPRVKRLLTSCFSNRGELEIKVCAVQHLPDLEALESGLLLLPDQQPALHIGGSVGRWVSGSVGQWVRD